MNETETDDEDDTDNYLDESFDDDDDDDDSLLNGNIYRSFLEFVTLKHEFLIDYRKPVTVSKNENSSRSYSKEKFDWNSRLFLDEDDSDNLGSSSMFIKGKSDKKENAKPRTDDFR